LAFTPNGRQLISSGKDTNLFMWDLQRKGTSPKILGQQFKGISTVSMHPILEILASGGPEQPITIWNLSQPVPIPRVLNDKTRSARHLQFSPNGKKLVALNSDNKIQVWNWQHSDTTPIVLPKLKGRLEAFDLSPDGLSIAVGGKDLDVSLWSSTSKLVENVCDKVTRNLSFDEWKQSVGENLPYERTCDNFPIHPSFLEEGKKLAKQGANEKAISIFKRAKELDPYLEFDPKKEAKKISTEAS
jgi:WD40 repeat protein